MIRFWVGISMLKMLIDCLFKFSNASEHASANLLCSNVAKETFDQVYPGS